MSNQQALERFVKEKLSPFTNQQAIVVRTTPTARTTPAARSATAARSAAPSSKPAALRAVASKPVASRATPPKPVVHSPSKSLTPVQKRVQKLPLINPHPRPSGYNPKDRHYPPYKPTKDYCSWGHRNSGKVSQCEFAPGAYICRYKHRCG
jgi:hypothetical protein